MSNQKNVAIGTVVGGVVGATAALLTAPKSGDELREDISKQLSNGKSKTEEVAHELKEKLSELTTILNESSSNVSQSVKQQTDKIVKEATHLLNKTDKQEEVTIDDIRGMIRHMMTEEKDAGKQIKQIVDDELVAIQSKVKSDTKDVKETVTNS
ncbi:YtxH domain-containing protein [Halalkalibacter sp. APA_J-10(15)]|uniref:YtxH domain-containing protein n=1 Tax=Halalkalibacter sp. APA_J-10(15) TaxID=2933805 RepID=UPI001FF3F4B9|nr:YtxH domain-containing protein [Halalkalibacter sp. APA_J-10(15)]MCK0472292.1 YtxH domain-containing protein [Halalkalibacter sp. APA_J-10(15)]